MGEGQKRLAGARGVRTGGKFGGGGGAGRGRNER
jgi:hypothetical protein